MFDNLIRLNAVDNPRKFVVFRIREHIESTIDDLNLAKINEILFLNMKNTQ